MTTNAMQSRRSAITDKTWLPLSMVVALVAAILAGYSYIAEIRSDLRVERQRIDGNCTDIQKIEKRFDNVDAKLDMLIQRKP